MPLPGKRLSLTDALPRIRTFCNYRDRCHQEVKKKLYEMGLRKKDTEQALTQMIEEDLLNEERFARSYARGHFYNKKWGKEKITMELRQRQINDRLIRVALTEIDEDDYREAAHALVQQKWEALHRDQYMVRKAKVYRYMTGKGYEPELVREFIHRLHSAK